MSTKSREAQLDEVSLVASKRISILLTGETGTGKEVLARAIHEASGRSGPFIAINCAALPAHLVESELFGHIRGAFSGAQQDRDGALVASSGGTLFLDEIGDAPIAVQTALLRAIELQLVKPVGAEKERRVDLRVVAATSRDVEFMILDGDFREDLYYRLAGHELRLPPLRERKCDLPALAAEFARQDGHSAGITPAALSGLSRYEWPGNIRQLKNSIQRAAAVCRGNAAISVIEPSRPRSSAPPAPQIETASPKLSLTLSSEVSQLSELWLNSGAILFPEGLSRRGARIYERLLLIALLDDHNYHTLPGAIQRRFGRLFSHSWKTADEGRSLRLLVATAGCTEAELVAVVDNARFAA